MDILGTELGDPDRLLCSSSIPCPSGFAPPPSRIVLKPLRSPTSNVNYRLSSYQGDLVYKQPCLRMMSFELIAGFESDLASCLFPKGPGVPLNGGCKWWCNMHKIKRKCTHWKSYRLPEVIQQVQDQLYRLCVQNFEDRPPDSPSNRNPEVLVSTSSCSVRGWPFQQSCHDMMRIRDPEPTYCLDVEARGRQP